MSRLFVSDCRTCGAPTWRCLSDQRLAFWINLDPTPLSWAGELAAHLNGHETWTVREHGQPTPRPLTPPHPSAFHVHTTHECWRPIDARWRATPPQPAPTDLLF